MPQNGPIAFAAAVAVGFARACYFLGASAHGFAWANHFSGRRSRCPRVGPLAFAAAAAEGFAWAHHFSARCADAQGGPISICSCCCRWLRLGPLISGRCRRCLRMGPWLFREALPTPLNGPIEFAAAAPMVMASLGPISFLGGAIDALKWADRNRHAEPIPIGLQWPKASKRAAERHSQMGLMRTANALMVNLHWPIKCIISLNTRLSLAYLPI
jgi:hypothetical protein